MKDKTKQNIKNICIMLVIMIVITSLPDNVIDDFFNFLK